VGLTRTEVRRAIGDRTGMMLVLTATHATDGAHFRDVVRLGEWGDDAPTAIHRTLFISESLPANLGHEARVSSFASTTRTLAFEPTAPAALSVGDEAELWSVSQQVTIGRLHRLINLAIASVDRMAAVEAASEPVVFDVRHPQLAIPEGWSEFGGGEFRYRSGRVRRIPSSHWRVRPGTRTAEISGASGVDAHRQEVTLFGYARAPQLVNERSVTEVDPGWLIETVLSAIRLAAAGPASDAALSERLGAFWDTKATGYRAQIGTAHRGLGISLS
jgi:hypothetical protein